MPAVYAHQRFGELVFESLPESLKTAFEPYRESFSLGFEGPDILFYHKPFKSNEPKSKGMRIHLISALPFFVRSAKLIQEQQTQDKLSTPLSAYVAGFICHFCLDNACHPAVYELEFTGVSHGLIESEFDKYLLLNDNGKAFGYNPARRILDKNGSAKASASVLDVQEKEIKRAIRTIRFINGAFVCRYKVIHKIIHLFLRLLKKDDSFGAMLIHHTDHEESQKIAPKMLAELENAVLPTVQLIQDYFEHIETTAQTGVMNEKFDKNYTGGILDEHHQPIRREIGKTLDPA